MVVLPLAFLDAAKVKCEIRVPVESKGLFVCGLIGADPPAKMRRLLLLDKSTTEPRSLTFPLLQTRAHLLQSSKDVKFGLADRWRQTTPAEMNDCCPRRGFDLRRNNLSGVCLVTVHLNNQIPSSD